MAKTLARNDGTSRHFRRIYLAVLMIAAAAGLSFHPQAAWGKLLPSPTSPPLPAGSWYGSTANFNRCVYATNPCANKGSCKTVRAKVYYGFNWRQAQDDLGRMRADSYIFSYGISVGDEAVDRARGHWWSGFYTDLVSQPGKACDGYKRNLEGVLVKAPRAYLLEDNTLLTEDLSNIPDLRIVNTPLLWPNLEKYRRELRAMAEQKVKEFYSHCKNKPKVVIYVFEPGPVSGVAPFLPPAELPQALEFKPELCADSSLTDYLSNPDYVLSHLGHNCTWVPFLAKDSKGDVSNYGNSKEVCWQHKGGHRPWNCRYTHSDPQVCVSSGHCQQRHYQICTR